MEETLPIINPNPPPENQIKPTKPWLKIILFSTLGLVLVGGLVFAVYKFAWVQQKREQTPSSRKELDGCRRGEDCIWAIRLDSCCACPEIASRTALGSNLVEYKPSEDYFLKKTVDCRNIACEPCEPLPEKIFCREGKCRTEKQAVSDPTAGWKTYRFGKSYKSGELKFEIRYPKEWQISEESETVKWYTRDPKEYLFFASWLNPDFVYGVEGLCRSGMCNKISEVELRAGVTIEVWEPIPERRKQLGLSNDHLHATFSNLNRRIIPEFGTSSLKLEFFKTVLSTFRFLE